MSLIVENLPSIDITAPWFIFKDNQLVEITSTQESHIIQLEKLQKSLTTILHSQTCVKTRHRVAKGQMPAFQCNFPQCTFMSDIISHYSYCTLISCDVKFCRPISLVLHHWAHCEDSHCPLCAPVRETVNKYREDNPSEESDSDDDDNTCDTDDELDLSDSSLRKGIRMMKNKQQRDHIMCDVVRDDMETKPGFQDNAPYSDHDPITSIKDLFP